VNSTFRPHPFVLLATNHGTRFRPSVLVEVIKSDQVLLRRFIHEARYLQYEAGINWLCVHQTCPFRQAIRSQGSVGYRLAP
jgi:hypothetical protein